LFLRTSWCQGLQKREIGGKGGKGGKGKEKELKKHESIISWLL
jgi:hypothetical protein